MKVDRTWYYVGALVVLAIIGAMCGVFIIQRSSEDVTILRQVYVMFSHGERSPTLDEIKMYPLNMNDPKLYYPYGYGALTNKGKMTMFDMGVTIRKLYDKFLPTEYDHNIFKMQSTNTDLSKMCALMVLAGLWPVQTDHMWNDLLWQPIPYFYLEEDNDYLLYPESCPRYIQEIQIIKNETLDKVNLLYQDQLQYLSHKTGNNITDTYQIKKLWDLLIAQENMEISTPKWFNPMDHEILQLIKMEYQSMFSNSNMKRLTAGAFFQQILNNSKQKIKYDSEGFEGIKMFMFSGYTHNLASVLAALNSLHIFQDNFGSSIVIELHLRVKNSDYAYKVFYRLKNGENIRVEIPGCGLMCPVKDFEKNMDSYLVKNYKAECKEIVH